ncbi:hypothetical protein SDC9_191497 [bioreactor metagenome]|uniref:Uncharacterized protein n=1 Tax=bioreactor metagenome TaxID=1076179 RepID=A0A645HZB9_9ZZZZ
MVEDAEAAPADGVEHQDAELLHFPVGDAGQRADGVRYRGFADFGAGVDQADAEGRVVLEAGGRHVQVALLEDLQGLHAAGKEHGVERKQRNFQRLDAAAAGGADEVEPAHQRSSPQRCISVCGTEI